jgi:hypothetical protein
MLALVLSLHGRIVHVVVRNISAREPGKGILRLAEAWRIATMTLVSWKICIKAKE